MSAARARADLLRDGSMLGKSDRFDWSIVDFSRRYADQNERDYGAFTESIRS